MHFVLTTKSQEEMPNYIANIDYKFIDIDQILTSFRLSNISIDENSDFFNIHFNIFVYQKLKNCLKNYKSDYFIYKISDMNVNTLTNIYQLVFEKYNHKVKKFIILDSKENLDKININTLTNVYYIEYVANTCEFE